MIAKQPEPFLLTTVIEMRNVLYNEPSAILREPACVLTVAHKPMYVHYAWFGWVTVTGSNYSLSTYVPIAKR
jgi:hypothetical protein